MVCRWIGPWFAYALIVPLGCACAAAEPPLYVGSKACQPCHAGIYASYLKSAMARTGGPVSAIAEVLPGASFPHPASRYLYRVKRENQGIRLDVEGSENGESVRATRLMRWFVGSGAAARAFLLDFDGFLFQSPATWYAAARRWDIAPGYEAHARPFLQRPVVAGCLNCHASQVRHKQGTLNGFDDPPFFEGGVSCERCHGPGSVHIGGARPGSIVNPRKLDHSRRDSVCAQCHLSGDYRVVRVGRNAGDFVPGNLLNEYVLTFVRQQVRPAAKVTGHVESLAMSACRKKAGEAMWCGSCHDPHGSPGPNQSVAFYKSKCLACHAGDACSLPRQARMTGRDDCVGCHMPKTPASDAQHVVTTDHSIPRHRRSPADSTVGENPLAAFGESSVVPRDLGIAYAMAAQQHRKESDAAHALRLLESVVRGEDADSEALLYLADLYNRSSLRERAIPLYERAIRIDPSQLTGSVSLGAIRMEQGNLDEAIRLWRDALRKNPGLVLVRFNLAVALTRKKDRAGAIEVLQALLRFDPGFLPARSALKELGVAVP